MSSSILIDPGHGGELVRLRGNRELLAFGVLDRLNNEVFAVLWTQVGKTTRAVDIEEIVLGIALDSNDVSGKLEC
jgi:hypothetical protein